MDLVHDVYIPPKNHPHHQHKQPIDHINDAYDAVFSVETLASMTNRTNAEMIESAMHQNHKEAIVGLARRSVTLTDTEHKRDPSSHAPSNCTLAQRAPLTLLASAAHLFQERHQEQDGPFSFVALDAPLLALVTFAPLRRRMFLRSEMILVAGFAVATRRDRDDGDDQEEIAAPTATDFTTAKEIVRMMLRVKCRSGDDSLVLVNDDDGGGSAGMKLLVALYTAGFELQNVLIGDAIAAPLQHLQPTADLLLSCFSFKEKAQQSSRSILFATPSLQQHVVTTLCSSKLSLNEIAHIVVVAAFVLGTVPASPSLLQLAASDVGGDVSSRFYSAILSAVTAICRRRSRHHLLRESRVIPALHILVRHWAPTLAVQRAVWPGASSVKLQRREAPAEDEQPTAAAPSGQLVRPQQGVGSFVSAAAASVVDVLPRKKEKEALKQRQKPECDGDSFDLEQMLGSDIGPVQLRI